MIRFYCPGCQAQLQAQNDQVGTKVQCGGCGQRLQVPPDPRNRTVLGSIDPPEPPPIAHVSRSSSRRTDDDGSARPRRKRERSSWECPECGCPEKPYRRNRISQSGWIVFALFLVFFFPLFFIGLLMTEDYYECPECRFKSTDRREFDPDD